MQAIPFVSISKGLPVIFLPLALILLASALKDFFEDYKRKKSDREENNQEIEVLENNSFVKKYWKSLYVGNIIKAIKKIIFFYFFIQNFLKKIKNLVYKKEKIILYLNSKRCIEMGVCLLIY